MGIVSHAMRLYLQQKLMTIAGCQLRFKLENDEMKKRLVQAPSAVIVAS